MIFFLLNYELRNWQSILEIIYYLNSDHYVIIIFFPLLSDKD